MADLNQILNYQLLTIGEMVISVSSIVFFLLVLVLTYWVSKLRSALFQRLRFKAGEKDAPALYVLERFTHYLILGIGIIVALSALGIDMSHLALLATALSVGLGFGLQSIFNNFFSGIIILFERSLKVDDFIELDNGVSGTVKEINIRATLIRTRDNLDILVPNAEFVNGRVTNWTLGDPTRRLLVPFGVAYGSNKELVKKAVLEAAERVPMTIHEEEKEPDVWLVNFGDSSLDFQLVVWVDPRLNTARKGLIAAYLWEIETSLNQYGIEIPFPQRDIHIKSAATDCLATNKGNG